MKKISTILLLLLLTIISHSNWAQTKTSTVLHKGKKLVWNAKPIQVETQNPKTGITSTREVLERGTLQSYDGVEVSYKVPKSAGKDVKKYASKAIKSTDNPKFHDRELTVHLTNFVIDTEGKLAYYEILFFPYKQSMQLYPNEYTEEIKAYLKKIDEAFLKFSGVGTQKQPIFSTETIVL